jgi:hypothetical protein
MPGMNLSASLRLASGAQLWRLNQFGWLRLTDEVDEPISSQTAKDLIAAELESRGESRFPGVGETSDAVKPLSSAQETA